MRQGAVRQPATIIEAMTSPDWWGPWFRNPDDWSAWRVFCKSAFGLPLDAAELPMFTQCTGRTVPPLVPASEIWAIVGRRGGKTRTMAMVAVFQAIFVDWSLFLAPGEVATVMLLAADRRQARSAFRYVRSLIADHPLLKSLIEAETQDSLTLKGAVVIEVTTASARSVRGYSVAAIIADELAFWIDSDTSANPATEILAALRPAMATLPGSLLMAISSPYARKGPLWSAFQRHYGRNDDPVLVWKSPSKLMNPSLPQSVIDEAIERDPASATAEYFAEFRSDLEEFVSADVVAACTPSGRYEIPPIKNTHFVAFCDPSGGASDSMTLAIAHRAGDTVVLDCVRERKAPFSPESATVEFADVLKLYGCNSVIGDRYGGAWPAERFKVHKIDYVISDRPKSDIYLNALPILNSGKAELLDLPRLRSQLVSLERRVARGGRDSIDHPPGQKDDVANAVMGALLAAESAKPGATWSSQSLDGMAALLGGIGGPYETFMGGW